LLKYWRAPKTLKYGVDESVEGISHAMVTVLVLLVTFAPELVSAQAREVSASAETYQSAALDSPIGHIQDQPDFSGHWKLAGPAGPSADFPLSLIVRQSLVDKTARGEAMAPYYKEVTVERELAGATAKETYQIGVQGGRVNGVGARPAAAGQDSFQTRFFVRWEGRRLVFETGRYEGSLRAPQSQAELRAGAYSERVEAWELGSDGRLNVSITTRGSAIEATTKSATYVRN
jgi:hypothetical protein